MEALGIFRFWRNTAVRADVVAEDDEEIDVENSLFDLALFKSPARGKVDLKKEPRRLTESPPRKRKTDFSIPPEPRSPPATAHRSSPKFKVLMLAFKKSPRLAKIDGSDSDKSVPKYLKLIKPFYAKASSSKGKSVTPETAPVNLSPRRFGEVSRVGSFKMPATRNLGKSRSAAAAAVAAPSIRRRDVSLLEQQDDGIQGAILHCKRSFTNSSSSSSSSRDSTEEQKRCSI